jgi:ATPase subunit of ABC transporter with duplicated ATPase domains
MNRVGKIVPPKKHILKDISLSFFPGAKIGVLGLNGSGKSTLLRIMAGIDKEIEGEAVPMKDIYIGYLSQEPQLNPDKDVRGNVQEGFGEIQKILDRYNAINDAFANPDADFDKLLAEQAELQEKIEAANAWELERELEINWTSFETMSRVDNTSVHVWDSCTA